ncbi:5-hydroxytryptamine receptor 3A-like [Antennarius striatus]|uniref:5-hydroxytryptamine receptor 3A-like n=1 Tax=Antennarius striatus TaxID=241820 RepID=UPI0035B2C79C
MRVAFLLVVVSTVSGTPSEKVCTYWDVVDYLNLTTDADFFKVTRPTLDYRNPTVLELDLLLFAILGVIEKTQTFIPFVWTSMIWVDERISWDPNQFCGISNITIPKEMIWKPDILIYEMIKKDDSPSNPYVFVSHDGRVTFDDDIKLVSTCRLDVHKFPFDTQRCNITIGSAIHSVEEIRILPLSNASRITQFSQELIRSQGEWEFLHLSIANLNLTIYGRVWEQLVFTFVMKRRPHLHVINFLLPILFFLCLDLASFFISDDRGEKLGFKVTVLLAISVLLLILNDILPAMSNQTPLIATYCILIFALMLLSLLVTILVTYLMDRDSELKDDKQEVVPGGTCNTEEKIHTIRSCTSNGLEPVAKEVQHNTTLLNATFKPDDSHIFLLILEELKELRKTRNADAGCKQERGSSFIWATRINKAFFIFYLGSVLVFLPAIFIKWTH